ncbi:MAG: glycoside hydrolase family 1 protein [Candidatus Thorarchaeota archaeon]|nr:glycoside hydrolase family 1 protein [Candidatus Thorarchaeota archaeon]
MAFKDLKFPDGFHWGTASSSHQSEGGNHNDWTEWEKIPGNIKDGSDTSVACDHYNRYEGDFSLAKEFGHQVLRFSIEWSRIEPQQGRWNDSEIAHYRSVVKTVLDRGIRPMMTLHHFTNPLWFRDLGAWLNPESPEIFGRYAKKVAESFADLDIIWNTINEPMVVAAMGYLYGDFPPQEKDFGKSQTVTQNMLMAHGYAATQIREIHDKQGRLQPQIAPVLSVSYFMPHNPENPDDVNLAAYLDEIYNHTWIRGAVTAKIPDLEGNNHRFKPLENSVDFIGMNYYSRMVVSSEMDFLAGEVPEKDPDLPRCDGLDWEVYPEGYYPIIKSYWDSYKKPLFMSENGIGTKDDTLKRAYILKHLQQVHQAIQDGIDIRGYLVWTWVTNFEWAEGFGSDFGLVGMEPETLNRIPRESAYMFKDIIQNNGLTKELQEKYLR